MSDPSRMWKQVDALHVEGASIRAIPVKDHHGKLTPWKPSIIEKMYSKIKGPIPFYVGHDFTALNRSPVGYGIKFGINNTNDDISYTGYVFDDDAIKQIIDNGYNAISPEVDNTYDESGELIDSTLLAMAFVKNPAFPGMQVQYAKAAFSKPEDDELSSKQGEPMSKAVAIDLLKTKGLSDSEIATLTQAFESEPATQQVAQPETQPEATVPPITPVQPQPTPIPQDMSALEQRFAEQAVQIAQLKQQNENLQKERYESLRDEVISLGFANAAETVSTLPMEQKIAVLTKMKVGLARTQPISTPTGTPVASHPKGQPDQRAKVSELLKQIGVTPEEFERLKTSKK